MQRRPNAPIRLTTLSSEERAKIHTTARQITDSGTQRATLETKGAAGAAGAATKAPVTMPLPKLPATGLPAGKTAGGAASPGISTPPTPESFESKKGGAPKSVGPIGTEGSTKGTGKLSTPERLVPERRIPKTPEVTLPKTPSGSEGGLRGSESRGGGGGGKGKG